MQLDEFVASTIYSVMKALKEVDDTLQNEKLGSVWTGDIKTHGGDLVHVRLVKAEDPNHTGKSIPTILFDYEVNVIVDETKRTNTSREISAKAKLLQVFSFTAEATGETGNEQRAGSVHKLSFTVPVALRKEKAEPKNSGVTNH